jgi:hypothetical protein
MTDHVIISQVLMKNENTGSHVLCRCPARFCLRRNRLEIVSLFFADSCRSGDSTRNRAKSQTTVLMKNNGSTMMLHIGSKKSNESILHRSEAPLDACRSACDSSQHQGKKVSHRRPFSVCILFLFAHLMFLFFFCLIFNWFIVII